MSVPTNPPDPKRVYLDCCCLQRPMDDQTQPRIHVEAEAVVAILAAARAGEVILLSSEALEFEVAQVPNVARRDETLTMLNIARERLLISDESELLAKSLEQSGVQPIDALHLALASLAKADYFATCDDRLLKKGAAATLDCKVISLLGLIAEVTT